jgi:dipeptidyl aminopeptidase/acylaminoacyl peptidase
MHRASSYRLVSLAIFATALTVLAQQPTTKVTADDYAHAESFLGYKTNPLVYGIVKPTWLPDDHFWYRKNGPDGIQFVIVDAKGTHTPAFDHAKVAAALSAVAGRPFEAMKLPMGELAEDAQSVTFMAGPKRFKCDVQGNKCEALVQERGRNEALSPDKKRSAFIRDWNLWVRDVASGQETQLTKDGVKDFGYATDNAGWIHSERPILVWSPDSKKIATFQQDQRKTGELYLVSTVVGHPKLEQWKYPLPGDENVTMIERVVIDVDSPKVVRLQMPPDQHRGTLCDHLVCRGTEWDDVQWSPDATKLAFVSTSRDHRQENLRIADASTGAVRDVLEEKVATYYESGNGAVNWRYLPNSNEIIWYSERDNWGQLYLYDLNGKLKNQITTGEGQAAQVLRVDEKNRLIYFEGLGKEKGRDPYFPHLYRVGFDGKNMKLLTPEDANHDIALSKSGKYFVDSYSKPDVPQVAVLRDMDGKTIATVEKADISKLVATGWKAPIPIVVKARDGVTDLYGLMFQPTNLTPSKKYPIINHIYPGPQGGSVGTRAFSPARGDCQALAELGFIVVEIDGMGNPSRSKKFHDFYFENMGDNTLPDQIAGMKELASRFGYVDLNRAGVYGHSGGGYAAADAMFRYPDFFKVGISEAGNHDNRMYEDDWAEKWQGLLEKKADGTTNYDDQANQNIAKNLKGRLLLAHGTMDDNVPPNNTLLVVDALIKANKDFDLIMLPNRRHGFGNEPYMVRRRWDYFVQWLLGAEPPHEYQMHAPADPRAAMGF